MADKIKSQFGVETELIAGAGGIFDVEVDGEVIFSRHKVGTFPNEDAVLEDIAGRK